MPPGDPFGEGYEGPTRVNPFGDDEDESLDPPARLRAAARKTRHLKGQVGVDGLPAAAFRTLLDEISASLDAIADVLEEGAASGERP